MQQTTGVHVQIAKETDMAPGETLRSIILKGLPEKVAECKKMIDEIIQNKLNNNMQRGGGGAYGQQDGGQGQGGNKSFQQRDLDHAFVLKVPVPNDKVGVIIGKQGMTIKGMQERCRVLIQVIGYDLFLMLSLCIYVCICR